MQKVLSLFWNPSEQRMRALLRLALTVLLMAVVVGTSQFAFSGLLVGLLPRGLQLTTALMVILTAAIVLSVFLAGLAIDRRPLRAYGLRLSRRWWTDFAFGLLLGGLLMLIIFLVELAAGWVTVTGFMRTDSTFWPEILLILVFGVCIGIQEELFSRGYFLLNLAEGLNGKRIGPRRALLAAFVISSIVFGLLHAANNNASLTSTLYVSAAGLLLGLGFVLTGDLAIPIGLPISWNFFQGNVFGFPVSGQQFGPTVIATQQSGPDWLTGGAFGPEAGVLGLLAIAIGIVITIAWLRWRNGSVQLRTQLAQYETSQAMRK